VVAGIDDQWSADLMDLVKFAKYNDGYRYILVVIDVFSIYLWLRKLTDKKSESVAKAFETIFMEGRKPYQIRTDKGQACRARAIQSVFKEAGIKHFNAQNEVKASVTERVIKTIKTKIYRYFTFKQSHRYIDKLQSFAEGYNHTIHSTIDMEPAKATKRNEELVRISTYLAKPNDNKGVRKLTFKFKIGDKVHITQLRNIFSREYHEKEKYSTYRPDSGEIIPQYIALKITMERK
jgi:hypothetical protein